MNRFRKAVAWLTYICLAIFCVVRPITGGTGPINGAQVIIRIDDDSVGPMDVAYQKDVTFDTTNALIDTSNKTSGRRATYLMGRLEEEISLNMLWSDDVSYTLLRNVARAGQAITVIRAYDAEADGTYANIEYAAAVITQLSESFPDQEAGSVDVTFRLSGNWTAGTP